MSTRRNRILLTIAFVQLALVTSGAAYCQFSKFGWLGPVGRALDFYGVVSGSNSSYGFFAPAVGGQVRARFEIVDGDGKKFETKLESGNSHEADLRVSGIIGEFVNSEPDYKRFDRSLAASLAGTVFGRHPEAEAVIVNLEEYWPVSMAEYRQGQRTEWKHIYDVTFAPVTEQIVGQRK